MATYIYVQPSSDLLRRNRAELEDSRIKDGKRRRAQQAERDAEDAKAAAEEAAAGKGQQFYGIRKRRGQGEEAAAAGFKAKGKTKLGHLWIFNTITSQRQKLINIVSSGDGSNADKRDSETGLPAGLESEYNLVEASNTYSYGFDMDVYGDVNVRSYVISGYEECFFGASEYPFIETIPLYASATIEVPLFRLLEQYFQAYNNYLVLPAGGETCIVVCSLRSDWHYWFRESVYQRVPHKALRYTTPSLGGSDDLSVYVVSGKTCRHLTAPTKLKQILDIIWPAPSVEYQANTYTKITYSLDTISASTGCPPSNSVFNSTASLANSGVPPSDLNLDKFAWRPYSRPVYNITEATGQTIMLPVSVLPDAPSYAPSKYVGLKATNAITPSIYGSLNEAVEFVSPGAIKQFPVSKRWIVETDDSTDADQKYGEYSLLGDPDEVAGGSVNVKPDLEFTLSSNPDPDFPDPETTDYYADRYTIWDWDDPAYCRQMLQALGFTTADLTP